MAGRLQESGGVGVGVGLLGLEQQAGMGGTGMVAGGSMVDGLFSTELREGSSWDTCINAWTHAHTHAYIQNTAMITSKFDSFTSSLVGTICLVWPKG